MPRKIGNISYHDKPVGCFPEMVGPRAYVLTLTVLKRMEAAGIRTVAKANMTEFEYECFLASRYIYKDDEQVRNIITNAGGNPDEILR